MRRQYREIKSQGGGVENQTYRYSRVAWKRQETLTDVASLLSHYRFLYLYIRHVTFHFS